jgi:hypothetical protein
MYREVNAHAKNVGTTFQMSLVSALTQRKINQLEPFEQEQKCHLLWPILDLWILIQQLQLINQPEADHGQLSLGSMC